MPVELFVATDYAGVVEALLSKRLDFAYLGGLTYVQAHARGPVHPMVTEIDRITHKPFYTSAIITRAGGQVQSLTDLNKLPDYQPGYWWGGNSRGAPVDANGAPVFLRDLWPNDAEVEAVVRRTVTSEIFVSTAAASPLVQASWDTLAAKRGTLFDWDAASSYIVEPPFFATHDAGFALAQRVEGVRPQPPPQQQVLRRKPKVRPLSDRDAAGS